jgi:hypothetical protein
MARKSKLWERAGREPGDGKTLFVSELGQVDLAGFKILHHGLDTVRQLFECQLKPEVLVEIHRIYDERMGEVLELGGFLWLVGSGGKSGYRYRLQNSDLGLIIFVKSNYQTIENRAGHIKIECSPHWIDTRDAETMERELTAFASLIADSAEPCGCAAHICCDIQGWEPGDDFLERIVTRARRIVHRHSNEVQYADLGEVATVFGKSESYLMGSPTSVQFALYRKDLQTKKTDKLHYWRDVWNRELDENMNPHYDEEKPVWRLEYRFHQNVIGQFAQGHAAQLEYGFTTERRNWMGIAGLSRHLYGLWCYGLDVFRLELSAHGHGTYVDPAWQLLREDIKFAEPEGNFLYRRVYKTPGIGNEKNLMLAVGNLLSCYARHRYNANFAFQCLKKSGIYDDLYNYMARRAHHRQAFFSEQAIYDYVKHSLRVRELKGVAA